jgi:DNA-binding NtrC family response regulator
MSIERVLVVEDEPLCREFVCETLAQAAIEPCGVENGKQAVQRLQAEDFDLVLSDLRMAEMDGLELVGWLKKNRPDTPVALMTAFGSLEVAVEALRSGVEDILLKPFEPDQISLLLERVTTRKGLQSENRYLRHALEQEVAGSEIVGESPAIRQVLQTVSRVAPSNATVFIRGESGTGKELVARAIHRLSDRSTEPFIRVNCAALSETLLESELFGHERGAFTGAIQRREGRFELADKGTLLLDEVSEVSPRIQAKLLRVLEEEEFERVGGNRTLKVSVRIIATSNRDLEESIRNGTFREDLFYRLHVLPIELPPLRQRRSDIPLLVQSFLRRFSQENGLSPLTAGGEVLQALQEYDWPGNLREMSNYIHRAVVLSEGREIGLQHVAIPRRRDPIQRLDEVVGMKISDLEREVILRTLQETQGNRTTAASLLGLTARTISNKIRLYRSQGHKIPAPSRIARSRLASGSAATEPDAVLCHKS